MPLHFCTVVQLSGKHGVRRKVGKHTIHTQIEETREFLRSVAAVDQIQVLDVTTEGVWVDEESASMSFVDQLGPLWRVSRIRDDGLVAYAIGRLMFGGIQKRSNRPVNQLLVGIFLCQPNARPLGRARQPTRSRPRNRMMTGPEKELFNSSSFHQRQARLHEGRFVSMYKPTFRLPRA